MGGCLSQGGSRSKGGGSGKFFGVVTALPATGWLDRGTGGTGVGGGPKEKSGQPPFPEKRGERVEKEKPGLVGNLPQQMRIYKINGAAQGGGSGRVESITVDHRKKGWEAKRKKRPSIPPLGVEHVAGQEE